MKSFKFSTIIFFVFVFLCTSSVTSEWNSPESSKKINRYDESLYQALKWRCIGPFRGGRATAVAGVSSKPFTYYFGATGGGVWKTEDGGLNWKPVSDGFFNTGSVGAIAVSEWDPNVVYVGMGESPMRGNVSHGDGMYKSADAGKTWKQIGLADTSQIARVRIHPQNPDLVYAAALGHVYGPNEERGVFRTKDGGKNWENITPKEMPKWSLISMIELSTFNPATAYIAVDRHELDDFKPYIYKTENYGKSWKKITSGLPDNTFVRVVREDPRRQDLLYAGTETGVFVSFDAGLTWQSLQLNLPVVPIHDMKVKEDDLVVATHGRSFWILDDLTPLHQITEKKADADLFLFKPRDAYRMRGSGFPRPHVGQNPSSGSVIYYYLKEKPGEEVTLEFLDEEGNLIRKFSSKKGEEKEDEVLPLRFRRGGSNRVSAESGMNRFIWNMRYPDAERVPRAILWGGMLSGPVAVPGTYQVKLTAGERTMTKEWEWKKDPRLSTTNEEFQEQFNFLIKIRDKITEVNRAVNQLRDLKKQVDTLSNKIKNHEKGEAGKELKMKLSLIEDELIQSKSKSRQDPLNYPIKLDNKIAALASVVSRADARPTDQSYELFKELSVKADKQLRKLKETLEIELSAFNRMVREAGIPAIFVTRKS